MARDRTIDDMLATLVAVENAGNHPSHSALIDDLVDSISAILYPLPIKSAAILMKGLSTLVVSRLEVAKDEEAE